MNTRELFNSVKREFGPRIEILSDKPEETLDSIIRTCWLYACGIYARHEDVKMLSLPPLGRRETNIFLNCLQQKIEKMPLAYITGRQCFMGIEFLSDNRAMIPRKETELLAAKALELSVRMAREKKVVRVMDICCGAGCIGLTMAHRNRSTLVFSTDLSHDAISLTTDNIHFLNLHNRVHAEQGNLFSPFLIDGGYENADIVICNPPYISSSKVEKMDEEIVGHEPILAFDGGVFGLTVLEQFIKQAPGYVSKNGWVIIEVGAGQGQFIVLLCKRSRLFQSIETICDNTGTIRVVLAQKL